MAAPTPDGGRARRGPATSVAGPRPVRAVRAAALCLCALLAAAAPGCGGKLARGEAADDGDVPGRLVLTATPGAVVSPNYRASFRAVEAALRAGDDELAGAVLARLEASPLSDEERTLAVGLRRVLRGRTLARGLDLELRVEPAPDAADTWLLLLRAAQDAVGDLRLELPPPRLVHERYRLTADGVGAQESRTASVPALDGVRLARGVPQEVELARFDVPMRGAVALRDTWRLELLAGTLVADDEELPAGDFAAPTHERVYLADFLPQAPVEPEVLLEYARREDPAAAPLVERAVRIAPERHAEALDAFEPLLRELAGSDPEATVDLLPALRWLAGTNAPGVDPVAWVRYIRARREQQRAEERRQDRPEAPPRDAGRDRRRGELALPPRAADGDS